MRFFHFLASVLSVKGRLVEPDVNGEYTIEHRPSYGSTKSPDRQVRIVCGIHSVDPKYSLDSFKWLVLGDWGGWPAPHFSSPIQKSVADSMGRTSRLHRTGIWT